ncbi:restriction endonuclease subunit S [Lactobacillus intestinalis]|uniref:Type I restriction endonuclease S subunit domain protein n=1 Tax=Lactobacillus intestinalis DSM 6629 TaxID=1423761 RepID=A0ABR5PQ54_9LACO|nr:restriction endonuclease subunit S [Lactobacillus intestinalis]KRM33004.1 type I restriction endonuclease S subunit domain protein [Lactobacillus intestinalis DSM 6629]UTW41116.1 restriction endonuclease subunit S [Lactobacillus intestinalis]
MTKSDDKRVPALRFKGFTDDWEQRKGNEIFISKSNKGYTNLPVLSATQDMGMVYRNTLKSDIKYQIDNLNNYKHIEPGDFVIHLRSFQGGFAYSNIEGIASPAYKVFAFQNSNKFNDIFWKEKFKSYQFIQLLKKVTYGVRDGKSISYTDFITLRETFPSFKEQKQIGDLLNKINALLSLQQRKVKQLKLLKRAMLQTLFTNKSVPQLRFKGFTDNWEQRKLKDQAIIIMGQSPDGSTYSDKPTKYILVQGNADIQNGWVKPRVWTTQLTKLAKKGDILLSVRAPVGKVGRTNYDVVLGRGVAAIKGNNFLFFLFHKLNIDKYWKKYSTGSTFESINSADIRNTIIHIPQKIEQTRIGTLVSHIEKQITFQQNKIKKLESLKQFLLQNMFI